MKGLLAAALFFAAAAPAAAAAGLVDLSTRRGLSPVEHPSQPKPWTSYLLHSEDGLSVFLTHLDPGVQRNAYRLKADAVAVCLHDQARQQGRNSSAIILPSMRGDVFDQREGDVSGGWFAAGAHVKRARDGVDMLFVTTAPDLPEDLDPDAGKEVLSEKGERPTAYLFGQSRAQVDEMTGDVRRARIVDGPSLKVDLIRLAAKAAIKNNSSASSILFAVANSAQVRTTGPGAALNRQRIFITPPGAVAHLAPDHAGKPAYLLLITPAN